MDPVAAQHPTRPDARRPTILIDDLAVDHDQVDANGRLFGFLEGSPVGDRRRVEHDDVGECAGPQHPTIDQPELSRGETRHAMHCIVQGQRLQLANVAPEYSGKGAPKAWVRMFVVRQPVGTDHAVRIGHDASDVGLVHHEVDHAGRLQADRGGGLINAPRCGDVRELTTGEFGMSSRPRHDDPRCLADQRGQQLRGTSRIGIDIERYRMPAPRLLDPASVREERPKFARPMHL